MSEHKTNSLDPFFDPQGIVVIGVSLNPAKLGYHIAQNLVGCGYQGGIYFVNPKGGTLFERSVYTDVRHIPGTADLAVLLIPAQVVPTILEACGEMGIKGAIIASGGFREIGEEGAKLEQTCLEVAQQVNMRLIGPNCIGLMDTNFPLNTTFLPPPCPPKGDIALISHSGAVCAISVDWSRGQDFGFSRLLSLGNQADVTETDMLEPVAADKHTRVLALYLEGVSSGDKFIEEARKASRQKPVLALKAGRTSSGKKAAASHTGALAGTDVAYEAAFRRAGIQRAQKVEEMFNWARALAWCPLPRGNRIAILTNAGGPGVMAADEIETSGLILANLEENTKSSLCELLVPAASVENPVDMLATASPKQFAESLRILLADAHVDGVLLIIPPPPMFTDIGIAEAVIPVIQTADKPVVVTLMGHDQIIEGKAAFREARIPIYSFPEPTVSAMAALVERARILEQEEETIIPTGIDDKKARELLAAAGSGWLPPQIIDDLLHYYGIPTPLMAIAHTAAEAVKLAAEIGFPVALKIISPGIIHKSEAGGIVLNLTDAELVAGTFADMTARAREIYPDEEIEGIMVQKMVRGGQEVISGVSRDPQFGPLVMFGSGGVEVEGLQDVAFELAPLTHLAAQRLLQETWAGKKLAGFRHIPAVDKTAVLDILIRLGQMTADHPQIVEIEINPLLVLAEGATAVDVRVRLV